MQGRKNRLLLLLGVVGICVLAYALWSYHQSGVVRIEHDQKFAQPVPSGLPNFLNATPGAPPPQP